MNNISSTIFVLSIIVDIVVRYISIELRVVLPSSEECNTMLGGHHSTKFVSYVDLGRLSESIVFLNVSIKYSF